MTDIFKIQMLIAAHRDVYDEACIYWLEAEDYMGLKGSASRIDSKKAEALLGKGDGTWDNGCRSGYAYDVWSYWRRSRVENE